MDKKGQAVKKLDYKKEYKDLYMPSKKPSFIQVPEMRMIMVEGKGDPNTSEDYKQAIEILYGLSFGIKMSKMSGTQPDGYFEYVVPPLEGLWWDESKEFHHLHITDKSGFCWYSMIRQPEFVTKEVFDKTVAQLSQKRPELHFDKTNFVIWEEGLCAQVMHYGPYDDEPATLSLLDQFIEENGYETEFVKETNRLHHEIYLGDPRKTRPENLKTVLRHPVKKK